MMAYKFNEVLNDLVDCFLLGDIELLAEWKQSHGLADDLASEFTTNESGDQAVAEGIVLPMSRIANYPYTIIFTWAEEAPLLLEDASRLQFRREGYTLQVAHEKLVLFTWPILRCFTSEAVAALLERYRLQKRPMIAVPNGWYSIEVLGGETLQDGVYEPTLEFILRQTTHQMGEEIDFNAPFTIESSEY